MSRVVGLYNDKGHVFNTVQFDTDKEYNPPEGVNIIDNINASIGDTVVDGVLVKKEEDTQSDTRTKIQKIRSEYPPTIVMMESIFKQFSKMESEGGTLHLDTKSVLDAIDAANQLYSQ